MEKKSLKEPILTMRNSRKTYLPIYFLMFALLILLLYFKINGIPLTNLGLFSVVAFIFFGAKLTEVHRFGNKYEINPLSIVHTKGYLNTRSNRLDLDAISHIEVSQNFWQRILNYGSLEIMMFGHVGMEFKNINHPHNVATLLEEKMKEVKNQNV